LLAGVARLEVELGPGDGDGFEVGGGAGLREELDGDDGERGDGLDGERGELELVAPIVASTGARGGGVEG
jgi:hypothetical protein